MGLKSSNGAPLRGQLAALATAAILASSATAVLVHDNSDINVVTGTELVSNMHGESATSIPQITLSSD